MPNNIMSFAYNGMTFKTGDKIKCTIDGVRINDAVIEILQPRDVIDVYLENEDYNPDLGDAAFFIHHNNENYDGEGDSKYGYEYSYFANIQAGELRYIFKLRLADIPEINSVRQILKKKGKRKSIRGIKQVAFETDYLAAVVDELHARNMSMME